MFYNYVLQSKKDDKRMTNGILDILMICEKELRNIMKDWFIVQAKEDRSN